MRCVYIFAIFCIFGYSSSKDVKIKDNASKQNDSSITLTNCVYVDIFSPNYTTQHPLVCGAGRDFPNGVECGFKEADSKKVIHTVFPKKAMSPKEFRGFFVLHGNFQGIKMITAYGLKKPDKKYRYFVVSSWKHKKKK